MRPGLGAVSTYRNVGWSKRVCFARDIDDLLPKELEQIINIYLADDMYACSCFAASGAYKAGAGLERRNLGRDYLRLAAGRGGDRISSGSFARRAGVVGAGWADQARSRSAIPAWYREGTAARRSVPPCGCSDGNGRRVGQPCLCGCGGRDMGRSGGAGFHRHAKASHAGRGSGASMLASAAGGLCPSVGGAYAMAGGGLSVGFADGRSGRAGRSVLAGRSVQVAPVTAGRMGCAP